MWVLMSSWQGSNASAVLVVDDNESIRRALCEVFASQADFDVCGEAENGQQAIREG